MLQDAAYWNAVAVTSRYSESNSLELDVLTKLVLVVRLVLIEERNDAVEVSELSGPQSRVVGHRGVELLIGVYPSASRNECSLHR
jgi:hypothetical protein